MPPGISDERRRVRFGLRGTRHGGCRAHVPLHREHRLPCLRRTRRARPSLSSACARGTPIVGMEPSCLAVFKDEPTNMFPHDHDAEGLKRYAYHWSEFSEHYEIDVPRAAWTPSSTCSSAWASRSSRSAAAAAGSPAHGPRGLRRTGHRRAGRRGRRGDAARRAVDEARARTGARGQHGRQARGRLLRRQAAGAAGPGAQAPGRRRAGRRGRRGDGQPALVVSARTADAVPSADGRTVRRVNGPPGVVRAWLVWWILCAAFWLALIDRTALDELLTGVVAAAIGATAAVLVRQQRRTLTRPRARWVTAAGRPLLGLVRDLPALARALVVRGVLRGQGEGVVQVLPFGATGNDPRSVAYRVWTAALGSLGPNT